MRILIDISDAICFLHKYKVHHGDLRSSDILLATDGTTKIFNSGLRALAPWHDKELVDSTAFGSYTILSSLEVPIIEGYFIRDDYL